MAKVFKNSNNSKIPTDAEQELCGESCLTEAEHYQLLVEWNETQSNYPQDKCIHQLFEAQVERSPNAVAVVFEGEQLTYRELNAKANQLAHYLKSLGVKPEVLVGICVERSLEMVVGLLGILKAGGAYVPLDPAYPNERLAFMLEDSSVPVLITETQQLDKLPPCSARVVCLDSDWSEIACFSEENPTNGFAPDSLAYVIYTSGSTGKPKGVCCCHTGIVNLYADFQTKQPLSVGDRCSLWTAIGFDVSVYEIFSALLAGGVLYIVSNNIRSDTQTFLNWLNFHQIHSAYIPPFMLNQLSERILQGMDKFSLRRLLVGVEPIPARLLASLSKAMPGLHIINGYGPTEATICATLYSVSSLEAGSGNTPIGKPVLNTKIYLLDEQMQRVAVGVSGELYISGVGLAREYLNQPDLTNEKFISNPFSNKPGSRLYKTGDLARYLPDGNIEFIGRIDQQVKIRGFRVELGEIESVLRQHPAVRETVVVLREDVPNKKQLVAYVVHNRKHAEKAAQKLIPNIRSFLQKKLPDYMVPSAFVLLDALPLTPNGKVARLALPAPDTTRPDLEENFVAPRTHIEEVLAGIWSKVLGLERVGIHDKFLELGGHSLLAIQILSRLRDTLKVELPVDSLFTSPTVAELALRIEVGDWEKNFKQAPSIQPISRNQNLPLSWSQEHLWFLAQLEPDAPVYNEPFTIHFGGALNVDALSKALNEIIKRHESLRTNFITVDKQPVQAIALPSTFNLTVVDLRKLPQKERETEALRLATIDAKKRFDLRNGLLLRATLMQLADEEYRLFLTCHHIVIDGFSVYRVFLKELETLYEAFFTGQPSSLTPVPVQYVDFALWQRQRTTQEILSSQLNYWKQQLADLPVLHLPYDRPRSARQTFRGARLCLALSKDLTEGLKALSQQSGVTLYMTLLAAFNTLLYRYTGQEDIVVGTVSAGRNQPQIEGLVGYFLNTLVLRTDLSGCPSFLKLLSRVREVTLGAYAHEDLPFRKLVKTLQPERNLGQNPLFQVAFVLEPPMPSLKSGWTVSHLDIQTDTAKFDLTLELDERPEGIIGRLEYNTDLFETSTISQMAGHFQILLSGIVANPQQPIPELPLLIEAERQQLLVEWNNTTKAYSQDKCIHQLFEEQVKRSPTSVAVVFEREHITYRKLNAKANQLAHYLQTLGVGPEVLVGICVERSLEMVVGLLAILKAGGAYVPLDPTYPAERLAFMLEDTQARVLLTQQQLIDSLPSQQACLICLDTNWEIIAQQSEKNPISGVGSNNLAYTIYTSGSTGTPKGVAIEHSSVGALSAWAKEVFTSEDFAGVLASTSISFDLSVFELFVTLSWGGKVILAENALHLPTLPAAEEVTLINTVPSAIAELLRLKAIPLSVRTVNLAGEPLQNQLVQQIYQQNTIGRVFNLYGPSEDTTYSTFSLVKKGYLTVTIGRPIANTQVYLLDAYLKPVPIGIAGELYIGGDGLARGYLNRPKLTAEKFIPNPFSSKLGSRLYKTGDKARYLPDGNIEFTGRIDNQVKIRGFRIELGEVETVLRQHSAVQSAIVIDREEVPNQKQLVAYLVQNPQYKASSEQIAKWQTEQISQMQVVADETYRQISEHQELKFNIVGWNSSYTGLPIVEEEMREWVNQTVKRILSLRPSRVLEIGCGTGLLLFRIAPHCTRYYGTDLSQEVVHYLKQQLQRVKPKLPQVEIAHKTADDFEAIKRETFDAVILNSVCQYFPSIEYLLSVLEGAVNAVAPGGLIFVGDVRSLPLLEAYHTSIQLHQAPDSLSRSQLVKRVRQRMAQEEELVIDPAFFTALKEHFPQIGHVQIQLKRGVHHNELTRFRYDVILHIGTQVSPTENITWLDWQKQELKLPDVRQLLQSEPETLGLYRVPNARIFAEVKTLEWLLISEEPNTLGEWRSQKLPKLLGAGVDPEELWAISHDLPYAINISWTDSSTDGCYNVVFRHRTQIGVEALDSKISLALTQQSKHWSEYANNPLQGKLAQNLIPDIRNFLQEKLPDYMVPDRFAIIEALPLTSNGKVDRRALMALDNWAMELKDNFVAPTSPTEKILATIWTEVLGLQQVGVNDNFFELGGHSLLATQIISRVRDAFTVEIPLRSLFEAPTIAQLQGYIQAVLTSGQSTQAPTLVPISRPAQIPLSFAQARLWFLDQLQPENAFYNIALALRLSGQLNLMALESSINEIIRRHESLRTNFTTKEEQPVQIIAATLNLKVVVVDLENLPACEQEIETQGLVTQLAVRHFELEREPLFRANVLKLGSTEHVFVLVLHHIIADGWSLNVLQRELATCYEAFYKGLIPILPVLPIQYADFALWQRNLLTGEVLQTQINYWQQQLKGIPTLLELPTDRPRPAIQNYRGAHLSIPLSAELSKEIALLSKRAGVTLFMTLLAAFQTLLYRYTDSDDIVVSTPIANRNRWEIERLIGFFVNTLVLRTDLSGNPSFEQLLGQVREVTLGAYAHQDLPFEELVEALQPERSLSHSPLFQVMFTLENTPIYCLDLHQLTVSSLPVEISTAKFDLTLSMQNSALGLIGVWEYSTDLFNADTIARMAGHLQTILEAIVANPKAQISKLPMLPCAERQQLLVEWNNTQKEYPQGKCIHQLFEEQVENSPDAVAVVFEGEQLTYQQLNAKANQLAHYLQALGVEPETLVGICVERSLEMVVGLLGILKAGGAYVPLDPAYPQQRLELILSDSQVPVLLTDNQNLFADDKHRKVVCLRTHQEKIATHSKDNSAPYATPKNLAYVIYTSGSTGKPKGVEIPHSSVVNFLKSMEHQPGITKSDVMLAVTTVSFDIATLELYLPLITGAKVVLASREIASDGKRLLELIDTAGATIMQATPASWQMLLTAGWSGSRQLKILCGGESLTSQLAQHLLNKGESVWNLYGPTETTIWSTVCKLEVDKLSHALVTIGSPIDNTQVYLLNADLMPVPVGVSGEIYIAGDGLARGYLNRPDLTAEKFIPNPFSNQVGSRLYKTGDLARYLQDGSIELLDRIDNQVKIRGFRIELGEIEAVLTQHRDVREALVLDREDIPGNKRLVAYIVSNLIPNRLPYQTECQLELDSNIIKLQAEDISNTGVGVVQIPTNSEGKDVRLHLVLPGENEARWLSGTVAWSDSQQARIKFQLTPTDQALVEQSIEYLMETQGLWKALQRTVTGNLRYYLKQKLPDYMIPSAFVLMNALPLTPNGKVDRRALMALDNWGIELEDKHNFVAPRTPTETILAAIWAEVLGVQQVGVNDNFFELGGHSLLATKIISRIWSAFSIELPLRSLFEAPTIASLAQVIKTAQKEGLQEQSERSTNFDRIPPRVPVVKLPAILSIPRNRPLSLSFAQQRLWFLDQLTPNNPFYNIPQAIRLTGTLDVSALEQSLNHIVQRHESLRTAFGLQDGQPVQNIIPDLQLSLTITDLRSLPESEREPQAQTQITIAAQQPFNLAEAPLLRCHLWQLNDRESILLLVMHHIISDAWSIGVLVSELVILYEAYTTGRSLTLPALPIQYADFACWHREWLQDDRLNNQIAYWKQQLANVPEVLDLPCDRPRPSQQSYRGATQSFILPLELVTALKNLSQREGVTLFMTLLAAFQTLLYRYTEQPDIVVGSPISNRHYAEVESLIGFFVNTLMLRTDLSGNPSFQQLLSRVRKVALGAYTHQDVPFEKLVEVFKPTRDLAHTPLFQVMFVLQNVPTSELELPDFTLAPLIVDSGTAKFDLTLSMYETKQGGMGIWEYNTDLFNAETIARMAEHFQTLLESIVANPNQSIAELPLLTEVERHQLLVEWNNTKTEYPQDKCSHQLFEAQVERTPDAIAVVFEDQHLTYKELNQRANQLAHYLRNLGVSPEVLVGICVERSIEMIVGILGILKAGGAYMPLDPAYPSERLAYMLEDAAVPVLLTGTQQLKKLPQHAARVVCLDSDWLAIAHLSEENPTSEVAPDNLVYAIYTSGSTGNPKGVLIEHRGLLNLVKWHQQTFAVLPADRATQLAAPAFDASAWELWPYLAAGASIYIANEQIRLSPKLLRDWLLENAITICFLPTPLAESILLLDWPSDVALRTLLTGGDKLHNYPLPSIPFELVNHYGPTENTVVTTSASIPSQQQNNIAPTIGRPISNTQVYLLDSQLQLVPMGVSGELYIGGDGLARGYLHQPNLTQEKFIPNPFSNKPGSRLYKTGDLACYLPDGNIEFLGRIDHQVKIRGFRIELGEIETVLGQHPAVQQAVVVVREEVPGDKRLVAYCVSRPEIFSSRELRAFLKQRLPHYMVPVDFVPLEALPLTPNGKVDRRALPAPDRTQNQLENYFVAPRTPTEVSIANIWTQVLGLQQAGIHDNFFELGGHSLSAVQIVSRIRETFEIDLPLSVLFETPTIATLSQVITSAQRTPTLDRAKMPPAIVPIPRNVSIPLSFSQYNMWYAEQHYAGEYAGNTSLVLRLTGSLSPVVLEQSLNKIICRHEILRTTFPTIEGQPTQSIAPSLGVPLQVIDLQHLLTARELEAQKILREAMNHRFDLAVAPLIKSVLIKLSNEENWLLILMHHIITDAWSNNVFLEELTTLYDAFLAGKLSPLPEIPFQYADFAIWQHNYLDEKVLAAHLPYWQQHLANLPTSLDLLPITQLPQEDGSTSECYVTLPKELTSAIASFSHAYSVTPFIILLTALNILLCKWSNHTDILVMVTIANRTTPEIEKLLGCFINDLPLRSQLNHDQTGFALLEHLKQTVSATLTHAIPPEKIWEAFDGKIEVLRTVNLVLVPCVKWSSQTLMCDVLHAISDRRIWDEQYVPLELYVSYPTEKTQAIEFHASYSNTTFSVETIDRFLSSYQAILHQLVQHPKTQLSEFVLAEANRVSYYPLLE